MSAAVRIALGIPLEFADASVDDLAAIPGVGRRTAERLVERRARNPGGTDPLRVPGIGPRTGDRLRAALRFGPVSPPDCR
jgi:predicted DNA-binding helix-hairpin-helix protein